MNLIVRQISSILRQPIMVEWPLSSVHQQLQQWRGIRVRVNNGNLEEAMRIMQQKMRSSGMERLLKRQDRFHFKNSEKRVLAKKSLDRRIRSEELSRKLQAILVKKVRGL